MEGRPVTGRPFRRGFTPGPLHVLAAATAGLLLVFAASIPIVDVDLWWQRRIGSEILQTRSVSSLGNAWAPFGDTGWTTTQWLAQAGYALLFELGGFKAITALRLLAIMVLCGVLAHTVLAGHPARVSVPVYVATLLGLAAFVIQDRPQTLALVGAAVLGGWVARAIGRRRPPSLWVVGGLTWIWANLHGSWILAPAALSLTAAALLADRETKEARNWGGRAVVAGLAGLLTPVGPLAATALVRFSGRTGFLGEWSPVMPAQSYALPLLLVAGLVGVTWARTSARNRSELIVFVAISLFALSANRNIPFGLVMMAPLSVAVGRRLLAGNKPSISTARLLSAVVGATLVSSVLAAVSVHGSVDPISRAEPRTIGNWLQQQPGPLRVLNTYEAAGVLLEFSDANVELGIDGRADRYEPAYVSAYFGAIDRLTGVDSLLDVVEPDVAVLRQNEALVTHLIGRGWDPVIRDGRHILLAPPPRDPP